MRLRDARRDELLSLEEGHPSTGKIPAAVALWRPSEGLERGLKTAKLRVRKGMEEGLQEHDRFAKAAIEIVMDGIEQFPITTGFCGVAADQVHNDGMETRMELLY